MVGAATAARHGLINSETALALAIHRLLIHLQPPTDQVAPTADHHKGHNMVHYLSKASLTERNLSSRPAINYYFHLSVNVSFLVSFVPSISPISYVDV